MSDPTRSEAEHGIQYDINEIINGALNITISGQEGRGFLPRPSPRQMTNGDLGNVVPHPATRVQFADSRTMNIDQIIGRSDPDSGLHQPASGMAALKSKPFPRHPPNPLNYQ